MSNGHIYAKLMAEYAEVAKTNERPWEEFEYGFGSDCWQPLGGNPTWCRGYKFRRKPRTININGYEVPEPYRGKLPHGDTYYVPNLNDEHLYSEYSASTHYNITKASTGIVHLTKKAAIAHAEALLSFTEVKS